MINHPKITVVVISTFLAAATYSLSVSPVYAAEGDTTCNYSKNKKLALCSVEGPGGHADESFWSCQKQKNGTWKCQQAHQRPPEPELKNALTEAITRATKHESGKQ